MYNKSIFSPNHNNLDSRLRGNDVTRIGVIGGGQLAQMLAQAAAPLSIEVYALVDNPDCPAQHDAKLMIGDQNNPHDVKNFLSEIDVLTFEFENVNFTYLENTYTPIYPPLSALKIAQDRELEKTCFVDNAVPTTQFKITHNQAECRAAINEIGLPVVIKTCRDGYDGKGQAVIRSTSDLETKWSLFEGKRVIVENLVKFDREVSIIAVRSQKGEIAFYPLTENQHRDGILRISRAPYQNPHLQNLAEHYAAKILKSLKYVGVLAIEFFVVGEQLIANEMAPRVHNSGHWTIEGTHTSQFENHIRAVAGLPLGSTAARGYSAMVNFIGELPDVEAISALKNVHFHSYHKTARPGRKLAHATVCAESKKELENVLDLLLKL